MNSEEELKKDTQQSIEEEKKYLQFKQELLSNPVFLDYLKNYQRKPEDIAQEYAREKIYWLKWGPNYKKWQEAADLHWIEDAFSRLEEIQQKKLFDMQCLWRAEKIQIKEIQISDDFRYWEKHILNCPFLERVTQQEVDLYFQYLQSNNFDRQQGWFESWQDYDNIKEAYQSDNANRNFPEWYDFYNSRKGTSMYLSLPDIRGQKEEYYIDLWHKEKLKPKEQPANTTAPQAKPKPRIDYFEENFLQWFVDTFEDKLTRQKFYDYDVPALQSRRFSNESWAREQINEDVKLLGDSCRVWPITAWYDWREALRKAADAFRICKISEALPAAYDQYLTRVQIGIAFEEEEEPEDKYDTRHFFHNAILRGRELAGEPRDFDF